MAALLPNEPEALGMLALRKGLEILDGVANDPRLASYQPYWAARAHLLQRSGAVDDADAAYAQAISLELDPAVQRYLQQQRDNLRAPASATISHAI